MQLIAGQPSLNKVDYDHAPVFFAKFICPFLELDKRYILLKKGYLHVFSQVYMNVFYHSSLILNLQS